MFRFSRIASIALLLTLACSTGHASRATAPQLQLKIRQRDGSRSFDVSLRNVGRTALLLDPGLFSGGAILRIPYGIELALTGQSGKTVHLISPSLGVLGTLGSTGIYLPPSSTLSFRLDLHDFIPVIGTGTYSLQASYSAPPGRVAGQFFVHDASTGKAIINDLNGGKVEVELLAPIWSGRISSRSIHVHLPEATP